MDDNTATTPQPPARWPWQRSLQARILLTYGSIFVVILALLMFVIGRVVYQAQLTTAERALELEAFLAANALQDPLSGYASEFDAYARWEQGHGLTGQVPQAAHDSDDHPAAPAGAAATASLTQVSARLQQVADLYASDTDARVTILNPLGSAVADSAASFDAVPNQLDQAEVQAALNGLAQRAVRADPHTGEATLYVATPIHQGDRLLGLVQMSRPMRLVMARTRSLLLSLAVLGVLALLVATGLAVGLARRLVRPVQTLERAALAIAAGDLSQRVPVETADELGALARAFNVMVGALHRTLEQQRLFVANASHELRTPVTNIKLRSEALLGSAGNDPQVSQRFLAEIDSEADRLGRLAGALLDLSSLEEAGPRPLPDPVDILPTVRSAAGMIQLRASDAGLTLVTELPAQLPLLRVAIDEVEAILVNLLDNALKYTPAPGEIRLSAQVSAGQCLLRVQDTGPGIPLEDQPQIFERFYRVDKARSRGAYRLGTGSGAGLGLSIVKALVEQNGGTIRVDSAIGAGTCFEIAFPVEASANGQMARDSSRIT
jgi:two-component system, OmpR family, sensor kinase